MTIMKRISLNTYCPDWDIWDNAFAGTIRVSRDIPIRYWGADGPYGDEMWDPGITWRDVSLALTRDQSGQYNLIGNFSDHAEWSEFILEWGREPSYR